MAIMTDSAQDLGQECLSFAKGADIWKCKFLSYKA